MIALVPISHIIRILRKYVRQHGQKRKKRDRSAPAARQRLDIVSSSFEVFEHKSYRYYFQFNSYFLKPNHSPISELERTTVSGWWSSCRCSRHPYILNLTSSRLFRSSLRRLLFLCICRFRKCILERRNRSPNSRPTKLSISTKINW